MIYLFYRIHGDIRRVVCTLPSSCYVLLSQDVPQSKKLKPLDLAVDPDDVLPVEPVKPKVVVKETIKPDGEFWICLPRIILST